MHPVYLKENFHYRKSVLLELLRENKTEDKRNEDIKKSLNILNKLKERNIIDILKRPKEYTDFLEDYNPDDVINLNEIKDDDNEYEIIFNFVGVIYIYNRILMICPKYLDHNTKQNDDFLQDTPFEDKEKYSDSFLFNKMKTINKVILKYQEKNKDTFLSNFDDPATNDYSELFLLVYFLNDYFENGLYSKRRECNKINGTGEINWDKTINNSFAVIHNNRPYYQDFYTRKRIEDEFDYFKNLHRFIITQCTKDLRKYELLDFFDLTGEEISEQTIEDFGDLETISNNLKMEKKVQFNTRNLTLLDAMLSYVNKIYYKTDDSDNFLYNGTKSFNLIWEKICGSIFDNKLETKKSDIFESEDNKKLIDLMPKITWDLNLSGSEAAPEAHGTLIPDIVSIPDKDTFIIFDGKYFVPYVTKYNKVKGVPGVSDVTKQYLYNLSFIDFINKHKMKNVANCFLMPTENNEVLGNKEFWAKCSLFEKFTSNDNQDNNNKLKDIQVRFLPADEVYSLYLNGGKFDIEKLELF